MPTEMTVTRDVTQEECPWLAETYEAGRVVYAFQGATYGCISPGGCAVTDESGKGPFFEMPCDSLMGPVGPTGKVGPRKTTREQLNAVIQLLDDFTRDLKRARSDVTQTDEALREKLTAIADRFAERVDGMGQDLDGFLLGT